MKILIVGKGGREHALARALKDSPSQPEIYACPGSEGMSAVAQPVPGIPDIAALIDWMRHHEIDLCVAGEEAWLAQGLADACIAVGIPCFGPPMKGAQLESSKIHAKEFMTRHQVPTGGFEVVDSAEACRAAIHAYPAVLKYNGLAAGKGVAVCTGPEMAEEFIDMVFTRKQFGEDQVFVEEFLEGKEVSVICAVSDGKALYFTPARDYKRLKENDEGPNTGGMGAVASRRLLPKETIDQIQREVIDPTLRGLVEDDLNYRGFLYFGIILTQDGPKVLEFNCRFGDPEAQAVLPLIEGDFAHFLLKAAQGELDPGLIQFNEGWCITLVLATRDYPRSSGSGSPIHGLDDVTDGRVYHAGTRKTADGGFETNGGRVLAVSQTGATRVEARDAAYDDLAKITFDGAQFRTDIGTLHFE
ncbi:MAG: phosphoribosylamine--glycine ligase [Verrucomicrobia bacterium]|nr:phosphoribosylamine--glycine ligase [Verrucomicrobiota bacterium]MCH8514370.1 phosphoribosylamine--glycine ligase [Kiritimatiellia bacterium]